MPLFVFLKDMKHIHYNKGEISKMIRHHALYVVYDASYSCDDLYIFDLKSNI